MRTNLRPLPPGSPGRERPGGRNLGIRLAPLVLAGLLALGACDSGEKTLAEVDPLAAPELPDFVEVEVIITRSCVPCHDSTRPRLEDCNGIVSNFGDVLRVVYEGTMPPGAWPRLTEREKLILERWFFDNGACSPCTEPCP